MQNHIQNHIQNQIQTYPSEWHFGKPLGSYQLFPPSKPTAIRVIISPPGEKQYSKTLTFSAWKGQENAEKEATKWQLGEAIKNNLFVNRIRYLDKDTIEVELSQGKIMKTDAKHIDKVKGITMHAKYKKPKTDNTTGRWYAVCQKKKEPAFNFGQLICNYNKIKFINNDSLDLRECNLIAAGDIQLGKIISDKEKVQITQQMVDIQYESTQKEIGDLPKNVWILGKHVGYTMEKDNGNNIEVRLHDQDDNQKSQTLNRKNFKSDEEFKKSVEKTSIDLSYKAGKTKNLIRIIDDNTIEVTLTQGEIMRTDKVFIPLLKKILVCISVSGNGSKYVVVSSNNNIRYHRFITGFNMVDHIDGNPLNNTLNNLRYCDSSMNNSNIHVVNNKLGTTGIKLEETKFGKSYVAHIKINGKQFTKNFNIKTYGDAQAKQMAISFRKKAENVTKYTSNIDKNDDIHLFKIELIKLNNAMKYIKKETVPTVTKYLEGVDLTDKERQSMYTYYKEEQTKYYKWCEKEYERISKLMINKITQINDDSGDDTTEDNTGMADEIIENNTDMIDEIIENSSNDDNINMVDEITENSLNDAKTDMIDEITENSPNDAKTDMIYEITENSLNDAKTDMIDEITENSSNDDKTDRGVCHDLYLIKQITANKKSVSMKKFNSTLKGKQLKKENCIKRSETLKKQKEELRASITEKQCKACEQTKSIINFSAKNNAKDGLQTNCKSCALKIKQEWKQKAMV